MPEEITLTTRFRDRTAWCGDYPATVLVATEDEVLDFANAVRRAGGAAVIDALMPSRPKNSESCLIANALNFSCRVDSTDSIAGRLSRDLPIEERGLEWCMYLPYNMSEEQRSAIVSETGCELRDPETENNPFTSYALVLPKHIGNAAHAFDSGDGFTKWELPGFE